jgi:dihydrofolate reductase
MRTVTYGGAVSLDGFLADAAGAIDWLHFSKDVQQELAEFWKEVDVILMGRKTYGVAAGNADSDEAREVEAALAKTNEKTNGTKDGKKRRKKEPAIRTYVFSRTLKDIDKPGVELVKGDAATFVRDLKQRPGGHIFLMGGGELAQSLIAEGLVDEVGLNIHPLLLGSGVPVFRDPGHRVAFTLTECRQIDGGCVVVKYTLKRP